LLRRSHRMNPRNLFFSRFRFAVAIWLLFIQYGLAADVHWVGNAQDISQASSITVTGTWAVGDKWTLTINSKSLTGTVPSGFTSTANVADMIAKQVDAANITDDLLSTEVRNFGGEQIPEFAEIDAEASASTVTFTSEVAGTPFTLTRTEVTAGDGALGAVTAVTAATGKNWLDNPANYDTGAVPADNDTLYFDTGDVSVLYALDYFRTSAKDLNFIISNDWTGQMGNPLRHGSGASSYVEYRTPRYLQYRGGSKKIEFIAGTTGATNQGKIWLDMTDQANVQVISHVKRGTGTVPTVFLAGGDATTQSQEYVIYDGLVHIDPPDAVLTAGKSYFNNVLGVGRPSNDQNSPIVYVGDRARMAVAGATVSEANVYSGQLYMDAGLSIGPAPSADQCVCTVWGGSLFYRANATGPIATVYDGGSWYQIGGNDQHEKLTLIGGKLDCSRGTLAQEILKLVAHPGSTITDPTGRCVTDIDAVGAKPSDLTLDLPANRIISITGTATP
jgi:hypothetical protein